MKKISSTTADKDRYLQGNDILMKFWVGFLGVGPLRQGEKDCNLLLQGKYRKEGPFSQGNFPIKVLEQRKMVREMPGDILRAGVAVLHDKTGHEQHDRKQDQD